MHHQKLLAINFGGIGDEILFLPTLQSIRRNHPDWRITLLLEPRSRSVEQVTDLIDDIVPFDIKKRPLTAADLLDLLGLLKQGEYDIVLSSGGSPMVALLLFLSGIKGRIGYASWLGKRLLTNPVPLNKEQYAANMYHDLVRGLGIMDGAPRVSIKVPQASRQEMQAFLGGTEKSGRRIILHPGTSRLAIQKGIIKTWPAEDWAKLIQQLITTAQTEVVLAGGPDDEQTVREITDKLKFDPSGSGTSSKSCFRCAYGHTRSLGDLAALIDLCDLMICVDSAPMHLAVGLNKPLVALFGPTRENRLLPASARFIALRSESQPLYEPGVKIPADSVFRAAMDLLKESSSQGSFQEAAR